MGFYRYDDRDKERDFEAEAVAAFMAKGGAVQRVPNGAKMKKIRKSRAATRRHQNRENEETLFDMSEF